jgi:peroxiredoxin
VGLPVGAQAPAFSLDGLDGEATTLDDLRAGGKPVVLVFGDPDCGPCAAFLPDLARYQRDYANRLTVALISRGTVAANRAKATQHRLAHVLLQHDREVSTTYQVHGTPSAVLIRADGMIGSAVAQGADQIRSLVGVAVGLPPLAPLPTVHGHGDEPRNGHAGAALPPARAPLTVGDQAPDLSLRDLSGQTVALADFRGARTLLLFWNPDCGFCQRILDDLRAWESDPPPTAPRLVLVSTGDVEANRAMGLAAPILLESSFEAGRAFGAQGTPSAVLFDEAGTVASETAVGGPAVLALAGYTQAPR